MPNCADNTGYSSRRSSRGSVSSHHAGMYNTMYQPGSGQSSRRSSAGCGPGSRRESIFLNPQDSLDSRDKLRLPHKKVS